MKQRNIKVLKKEVDKEPYELMIENELYVLQHHVGDGLIEPVKLGAEILLVINEEGKINGSLPNFNLNNDIIMGDCFFVGDGGADFISLTDNQTKLIMETIDFDKKDNEPKLSFEVKSFDSDEEFWNYIEGK